MTTAAHKEKAFEDVVEAHLLDHGWHKADPANYDRERALDPVELLAFVKSTQKEAWETLVRRRGEDEDVARKRLLDRLIDELNRRGTTDVLRRGIKDQGVHVDLAYFRPAHGLTAELVQRYGANRCAVVRQLPYSPDHHNTLDVALLLNGIPVATAELKNPLSGQTVEEAKRQYRNDRDPRDQLLSKRALVHFAVDPTLVFLTTRLAAEKTVFLPFNRGTEDGAAGNPPNPRGHRTAYLWEEVWERDAWLDILHRFVHTEPGTGNGRQPGHLIFPRYHQWDAVRKLTADAAEHGAGRSYLVQHSAGSGKSNTIAWLAHRLASLHDADDVKVYKKVVVITDRVVLDRQLQDTIFQFDHKTGVVERIDRDSTQLAEALMTAKGQVIVTTLQKFPFVLDHVSGLQGERYAVVVDEAHSSQTGETAKALKTALGAGAEDEQQALADAEAEQEVLDEEGDSESLLARAVETRGRQPNLSFFAFTATPKQRTLELFGTRNAESKFEAFHLYSMRQAIEEGFILDVLRSYVTYKTYWRLARKAADDPELDKSKAASAIARYVSLHSEQFAQKAEVIVEHFRRVARHRIAGRAKAMVVTRSRLHAVRMKQAIDRYVEQRGYTDLGPLVAFSGTVVDGGVDYTESQMNGFPESQLPRRFAGDEYRLLVVAEKYQTGYDQPLLHTMYVDKKLEGVKAVQTLSRLNRIHPGKDDTFVLDFANDAEDIQAAFKPFFETTIAEETDPNLVYNAQDALEGFAVIDGADVDAFADAYFTAAAERDIHPLLYQHLDPAVERFRELQEDDREEFRSALERFVRLYAFLAQVVPYGDAELEKLYVYSRFLALRLPRESERGLDLSDDIVLTHLRTQLQAEHDLSLTEGAGELPGFRGDAAGPQADSEQVKLSDIIDRLNERFGTSFTKADQLYFDQLEESMVEDKGLSAQAKANTLENFRFGFDETFEEKVVDRRESNEELFARILEDEDFSDVVRDYLLRRVYDRLHEAA